MEYIAITVQTQSVGSIAALCSYSISFTNSCTSFAFVKSLFVEAHHTIVTEQQEPVTVVMDTIAILIRVYFLLFSQLTHELILRLCP